MASKRQSILLDEGFCVNRSAEQDEYEKQGSNERDAHEEATFDGGRQCRLNNYSHSIRHAEEKENACVRALKVICDGRLLCPLDVGWNSRARRAAKEKPLDSRSKGFSEGAS